jgi:hypothetical protein
VEAVVECFKQDRRIWCGEFRHVEEYACFGGGRGGGLFDEDVFPCADGFYRPLVVQAVGEGNEDCVDGGVGEEFYQ